MPRFRESHRASAPLACARALAGGMLVIATCNAALASAASPAREFAAAPRPQAGMWPYDPATLVGPPVPFAILLAPAAAPTATPAAAGMRYELDPERASGPARHPLTSASAESNLRLLSTPGVHESLRAFALPGGGFMVDLTGIFSDYAILRIDANGSRTIVCGESAAPGGK
ncbi:MAG: hypothetical protein HOP12_07605 [Candidatus Eisenbacteria bacterium]|uniref:Uncharacterized protein n=1 Tax=Eiseniibacteriota bacterium TaxID=2212470 RepID=A0A849SY19_UNCEI|nr:hypothetical protein [Candidatus Eisenbacteria bacterium]